MGNITNRDTAEEQANQALVDERKQQIDKGEVPAGIERGHSPRDIDPKNAPKSNQKDRLQTHHETQETTFGNLSSQDPARIGGGRDRRTGDHK